MMILDIGLLFGPPCTRWKSLKALSQ